MSPTKNPIPRAASYTYLPAVDNKLFEEAQILEVEEQAPEPGGSAESDTSTSSSGQSTPDRDADVGLDPRPGQPIKEQCGIALPKLNTDVAGEANDDKDQDPSTPVDRIVLEEEDEDTHTPRSFPRELSRRLRERSWLPGSRSPSPRKGGDSPRRSQSPGLNSRLFGAGRRNATFVPTSVSATESSENGNRSRSSSRSRRGSVLVKKFKRPLSIVASSAASQTLTSSNQSSSHSFSLPKSFSSEKLPLPSLSLSRPSIERIPPLPRTTSTDRLKGLKLEPRKKDELWTVFRTLESEVEKFHAKSSAVKANVIRSSLLPFLRNYRSHPSDRRLRPEDLDRRAKILNLWWTGLLELLHGKTNQAISPSDRPAIFDGILGIMERPEWRLPPSQFCPLKDRSNASCNSRSASSTSLASDVSDFLTESVNHNVKNIFIQNLLSQMAFVVEKMSERQTPATTVNFCGRTCAYAFFFCPDIADILVRLWSPPIDLLFRVLSENGINRNANLENTSSPITAAFPLPLKSLELTTVASAYKKLKPAVKTPLGTEHVDWTGYWTNRWSGRESDLFYIFAKHFHLLAVEFLPELPSKRERLCAPGMIYVHAQLLSNIDATIHRNATGPEDLQSGPSNITFDDVLSDPDSAVPTLPVAPLANANRLMAENRIVMLLRDMLSDRGQHPVSARQIFAEAFSDLMKAAAKRTSMYNQSACYTLCDFLEEALVLLVRYEQADARNACVDWPFWLDVWKKMAASHNTSTEIRLYVLIFTLWQSLAVDVLRKREVLFGFLLEPEFFHSRFNHWCPLVRAYFMRLLCWRVARYDGEDQARDVDIYRVLSERLYIVYAHYLHQRQAAVVSKNKLVPSTAPSYPIPGRRLIIILTDPILTRGPGAFLTLDGIGSQHSAAFRTHGFPNPDLRPDSNSSSENESEREEVTGKRFGFLRTIIGTSRQERNKSSGNPNRRSRDPLSTARASSLPRPPKSTTETRSANIDDSKEYAFQRCFRFSIDAPERRRDINNPGPLPTPSPPQMRLFPPRLPLPAQQLLNSLSIKQDVASASDTSIATSGVSGAHGIDPTGSAGRNFDCRPITPSAAQKSAASYAGRALAEWALVIGECQAFFERRKSEGVPGNAWVETPALGVEVFRRPG